MQRPEFLEIPLALIEIGGASGREEESSARAAGPTGMLAPRVLGPVCVHLREDGRAYQLVSGRERLDRLRSSGASSAVVMVLSNDAAEPSATLDALVQWLGESLAMATRAQAQDRDLRDLMRDCEHNPDAPGGGAPIDRSHPAHCERHGPAARARQMVPPTSRAPSHPQPTSWKGTPSWPCTATTGTTPPRPSV